MRDSQNQKRMVDMRAYQFSQALASTFDSNMTIHASF